MSGGSVKVRRIKPPTNQCAILRTADCARCRVAMLPADIDVGFTPVGIQVWCNRHQCNVVHIDFEGRSLPNNTTVDPTRMPS